MVQPVARANVHLSMAKWSSRLPEEPLKYVGEAVMSPKRRPVPSNKERSLHGFFEGVQNFGQGLKINVSRLSTLKNGTESMRQPEMYEI